MAFSRAISKQPALDLVDGVNALAANFRYLEAQAYYDAFTSARDRRDFRYELLTRIRAILAYERDAAACELIQNEITREAEAEQAGAHADRMDPALSARWRDPKGYVLLNLSGPLSFDSLRVAYRAAAKQHHPDVGGDTATMQQINNSYALFNGMLRELSAREAVSPFSVHAGSASVERYFRTVHYKQLENYVDDLAADYAWEAYQEVDVVDIEQEFGDPELLSRLAKLMAAWSRPAEAQRIASHLQEVTKRASVRGVNYAPIYRQTVQHCSDPKHIRFVPNHERQARNLLRLGIINQARFDQTIARIGSTEKAVSAGTSEFAQFVEHHAFLRLPMDPPADNTPINSLVPAPGYYSRVEFLTPAQLREYSHAFKGRDAHLALKYLPLRLDALVRASLIGYSDLKAIISELRTIGAISGLSQGAQFMCTEALKITTFFYGLSNSERDKRIALLIGLDGVPGQGNFKIDVTKFTTKRTRPILVTSGYSAFATAPLERIKQYIRSGSDLNEQERDAKSKLRTSSNAFWNSAIYKRAQNATWARQKDSVEIVASVSDLCEAMYQRAVEGDLTLEIGHWTNKLTIHLVKLEQLKEAVRWIDRLGSLPEAIKRRTTGSVATSLKKRRLRCVS